MHRSVWKCILVLLLAVCMNMTTQAAYYAYTGVVKNQIQLMEVSQESLSMMMLGRKNDDFTYTTTSGSNASESNASASDAEREISSDSNAAVNDVERAVSSSSNAEAI